MKGRTTTAWLLGTTVFFFSGLLAAETVDREFHQRFDVAAGDALELSFGDGDVEIDPWDEDMLEVHVRYHVEFRHLGLGGGDPRDFTVDFERRGEVIRVRGIEPGGAFSLGVFHRRQHEYRYTVRAPSYVALDLRGDDGDVRISGWSAPVTLTSDDGDLEISDSAGELRLQLEDGDTVIAGHQGDIHLRLDDGDAEIRNCRSERVSVSLEDGDLEMMRCTAEIDVSADDGDVFLDAITSNRVDVRTADGDAFLQVDTDGTLEMSVRTQDGNVDLALGPGVSARYAIDSVDGRIRIEGPASPSRGRGYASGVIGEGAGNIRVTTGDGGVTLRLAEGAAAPAERPPGG